MAKRKKRYRGHYCWCCGRIRPNEQFSGKGHARYLCKACARLGAEELAYRQALRTLERCMGMSLLIPRKHGTAFNRFLTHQDPRIRAVAGEMAQLDAQTRAEWSERRRQEQALEEAVLDTWVDVDGSAPSPERGDGPDSDVLDDEELPF
jgi:hypothetical protein